VASSVGPRWRPYASWAAVVVPTWLVLVLGCFWEPVLRDGWPHLWWHDKTDVSLVEFAVDTYLTNNPRAGQVITWLLYAPGPWHVIITPLVELALFLVLATLVLGRWPSLRRTDDALVVATLVGMFAATCPLIGPMLFYRPYSGNYLYGLVLNLALLVPYRLALAAAAAPARRTWLAPLMFVGGLLAGLCNEHTDPALVALVALATVLARRRGHLRAWMVAGLVGVLAGALLLYFAPGQSMRYDGLATQQSVVERIIARGANNFDILRPLLRYVTPLALWGALACACAVLARRVAGRAAVAVDLTDKAARAAVAADVPEMAARSAVAGDLRDGAARPAVAPDLRDIAAPSSIASDMHEPARPAAASDMPGIAAPTSPRRVPMIAWLFAGAALAITLTLLASPKQGGRLYLASTALASAAMTTILLSQLHATWTRVAAWALAAFFAIRVGAALIGVYSAVGPEGHDRLAKIRSAAPGSTLTLRAYSRPRSRYFMGEDLTSESLRGFVWDNWGFAAIELVGAGSASAHRDDD
jgi:hypothetical protein